MDCPNCHAPRLEGATDCARCGIVFAKFQSRARGGPDLGAVHRPVAPPAGPSSVAPTLIGLAVVGGVVAGGYAVWEHFSNPANLKVPAPAPAPTPDTARLSPEMYVQQFVNVGLGLELNQATGDILITGDVNNGGDRAIQNLVFRIDYTAALGGGPNLPRRFETGSIPARTAFKSNRVVGSVPKNAFYVQLDYKITLESASLR